MYIKLRLFAFGGEDERDGIDFPGSLVAFVCEDVRLILQAIINFF